MYQYSFPILKPHEILSYLLTYANIVLEEHDLVKPTAEAVWPVYETLALKFMEETRDELLQRAFHPTYKLDYPEIYEKSIGIVASIRALTKLMADTTAADFSTRDIFEPESVRAITNLSAIINLLKVKQGREGDLEDVLKERERVCSLHQQSEELLASMNAEIEAIEVDRRAQQPAVQVLEAETKELNREIEVLNKHLKALNFDIRALKQAGQAVAEEGGLVGLSEMSNSGEIIGSDTSGLPEDCFTAEEGGPVGLSEMSSLWIAGDLNEVLVELRALKSIFFHKILSHTCRALQRRSLQLYMPTWFSNEHGEKLGDWIVLRTQLFAKKWRVRICSFKRHRSLQVYMYRGWKSFVVDNNLKRGDPLVFVFNADANIFYVYIFTGVRRYMFIWVIWEMYTVGLMGKKT